jgi:hypothetical protein
VRAAAIGITCSAILAFCGVLASTAAARDDLDPIGTVTSVVSPVSVASDLVDQAPAGSAVGSVETVVNGATGTTFNSSTSSGGSTSSADSSPSSDSSQSRQSSADRRARANGSANTRFDRLPRRYEVLLERIEFGIKLRASIARLRVLFASASPELQLRIQRLLRAEIRRLERGGLTNRERVQARRLRHVLSDLAGSPSGSTPTSFAGAEIASAPGRPQATPADGAGSPHGTTDRPFTGGPIVTGGPIGGVPDIPEVSPPPWAPPVDGPVWLWTVLAILSAIAFVLVLEELWVRWPKDRS